MEEFGKSEQNDRREVFSKSVRAGKRTYFFDVKTTRGEDYYLTITESKRRFSNEQGKFFYEKHKLFLYKEDFEKFSNGLEEAIAFIQEKLQGRMDQQEEGEKTPFTDVSFDDLEEGPGENNTDINS